MMNNDVMTDYEYDKNNRLINEVKVNNEITETTKYFYDNNGNQIYKGTDIIAPDDGSDESIGMSVVGTSAESSSVYNEYDGLNQRISTAVHDKVVLYSYDSDGLRVSKSVNGSKTDYIWDGQNIVAEINNGTLTNKYIRGINLIYGDFNGVKNWYLSNGHGDVVGLSDVNGNVLKLYDYDAFGNLCQEQNYKVLANILEDDFSTGLEKWDNTRIASIISDGGLRVDYNELVRSKNTINGDFVFEVDVKIQKSSAGIVFRGVDNYNYYMWQLTNGKLRPHKKVNNGWTVLKEVPASITENVMYHVKIEVVGNVIKTYINENLVDTTMDSTFSKGTVGFREAVSEIGVFDNVVVKQAGLTVFEDSFSVDLAKWNNTWVENLFGQQFEVNGNEEIRSKSLVSGDFVLEVDVKIKKDAAGIVFKGVDNYNYYMWQLASGKLRPHKKVNNVWTVLKEVPTSIDENVMYHVKIEVVGNVIKTYINENLVDTTMDSTFSKGTVGFREAVSEIGVFDNVVVKQAGLTVFEDSFSVDLAKWNNTWVENLFGQQFEVNGNEEIRSKSLVSGDFVLEVDVKIKKDAAGIVFRGVDNYNYYMWQLASGKLRPHKKVNNVWTVLKEVLTSIDENVMYHVKIEVVGNVIKTYINENLVDTTMDSTFSNGTVGFREAPFEVGVFDNVVVKSLQDSSEVVAVNPFRYCGEFWDEETGEYYLRARYYDTGIGRFISEDSVTGKVNEPLMLNLYTYCANNPLKVVDPSGHIAPLIVVGAYAYLSVIGTSLDTQMDMEMMAAYIVSGDYVAAALDAVGMLVPGVTGLGQLSKTTKKIVGSVIGFISSKTGKNFEEIMELVGKKTVKTTDLFEPLKNHNITKNSKIGR